MRNLLEKLLSTVSSVAIFGYLVTGVHEQMHFLVAKALGVAGHVEFSIMGGFFQYDENPNELEHFLIRISGGLIAGLIFLLAWYLAEYQTKYTKWELDDASSLLLLATVQLFYAWFDGLDSNTLGVFLSLFAGFAITIGVYGRRLWEWFTEE